MGICEYALNDIFVILHKRLKTEYKIQEAMPLLQIFRYYEVTKS